VLVRGARIYRVNQAFADLMALTVGDLVARPLSRCFGEPDRWAEVESQLGKSGNVIKVEQRLIRGDGRSVWVSVTGRATELEENEPAQIWVIADISTRKEKEEQSWYRANHDELTGLPNRRLLHDRFEQSVARARREDARLALMVLDLDGFKEINDLHGHQTGDEVLREVGERIASHVRNLDTVARLGGDEFVVLLHQVGGIGDVEIMAQRMIEQINQPMRVTGKSLSVSTSIGIALFPDHAETIAGMMHAADIAMYAAKGGGKNTFRFASAPTRHLAASSQSGTTKR
jgi:diguanylate cyclase (GGDEF)-like protein/PAS domain S-box-containing protein